MPEATSLLGAIARPLLGLAAWLGLGGPSQAVPLEGVADWAVFYGDAAPAAQLARPDLLVLEPDHPWNPRTLRREGQRVLAYLSLGEVHKTRAYFAELAATPGAIALKNPNWPDAHMIDPRSRAWRSMVLERVAPAILAKGYDGFFLDTLDVAAYLENEHQRPGARDAMVSLLRDLHARFPEAYLVANGGHALLPDAAPALSALATESVFTAYQFEPAAYRWREPAAAAQRATELQALKARYRLPVLVIEYVDPKNRDMARSAVDKVHAAGFVPFVSDIGLTMPGGLP